MKVEKIMRMLSQEDVRQQSLPIKQFVQKIGGDKIDYYTLREIFSQFGAGRFSQLPLVCVCTRAHLKGALSGYAAEEDTILLADDFVQASDEPKIIAALVQEVISALAARAVDSDSLPANSPSLDDNHPLAEAPDQRPFNEHP